MTKRTQKEFDLDDYSTSIDKDSKFYRDNIAKVELRTSL
jgi:hypothetical protein